MDRLLLFRGRFIFAALCNALRRRISSHIYALAPVYNVSTPYRCYLCVTNFAPLREVLNIEHTRQDVLNYVKLTWINLISAVAICGIYVAEGTDCNIEVPKCERRKSYRKKFHSSWRLIFLFSQIYIIYKIDARNANWNEIDSVRFWASNFRRNRAVLNCL